MVSVSVRYLFYQPMDKKIKTIVLQYDVKSKYRLICRKFSGMPFFSPGRSLNQPKTSGVCFRSIKQSNRYISVRLLLLFFFARFHFKVIRKSHNCLF